MYRTFQNVRYRQSVSRPSDPCGTGTSRRTKRVIRPRKQREKIYYTYTLTHGVQTRKGRGPHQHPSSSVAPYDLSTQHRTERRPDRQTILGLPRQSTYDLSTAGRCESALRGPRHVLRAHNFFLRPSALHRFSGPSPAWTRRKPTQPDICQIIAVFSGLKSW